MNKNGINRIRESSKNALKAVYYVIIGLAIVEALQRTFVQDGAFIGFKCFSEHKSHFILLFTFLPTVCRFVHGASIHLDESITKRYKTLIDFFGFSWQASVFYLMSLSLGKPKVFSILFFLMLSGDAIWLVVLRTIKYIDKLKKVEIQWISSDIIIIVILLIIYKLDDTMDSILALLFIFLVSLIATVLDYIMNKNFYFPN